MPNRNLKLKELTQAHKLLEDIRQRLNTLAAGDRNLLFAYRRKVVKELIYDERSKPAHRNKLKAQKRKEQDGRCTHCGRKLPAKYCELDRKNAADGYTV